MPSLLFLRPSSLIYDLTGIGGEKALANKRTARRNSHYRLSMLAPWTAEKELLLPTHHPEVRVKNLVDKMRQSEISIPLAPRNSISGLLRALSRKTTKKAGFGYSMPTPQANFLGDQNIDSHCGDLPTSSADWVEFMRINQAKRQAEVDLNEARSVELVAAKQLKQAHCDLDLSSHRAAYLTDRLQSLVKGQTLARKKLKELSPFIDKCINDIEMLNAQQEQIQVDIDQFKAKLEVEWPWLKQGIRIPNNLLASFERDCNASGLKLSLAHLQVLEINREQQVQKLESYRQTCAQLEQQLTELERLPHYVTVNAHEIYERSQAVTKLASIEPALKPVMTQRTQAAQAALDRAEATSVALQNKQQAQRVQWLKKTGRLPGFEHTKGTTPLHQALEEWATGLTLATTAFGSEALKPNDVLEMVCLALSSATQCDTTMGAKILRELRTQPLQTVVPHPNGHGRPKSPLSRQAMRCIELLASVPRGIQVLTYLMAPSNLEMSKERRQAIRIQLRAEQLLRDTHLITSTPPSDSLRTWLKDARQVARRASHAPNPSEELENAPAHQRAAYHALRNGYESNAPGSAYDLANKHLQKPADWLHNIDKDGRSSPLRALPQAVAMGSATATPTPRRQAHEVLSIAGGHLSNFLLARRQLLAPSQFPSDAELAFHVLSEYIEDHTLDSDLTTQRLDTEALNVIKTRRDELREYFRTQASHSGGSVPKAAEPPPDLHAAWRDLRKGKFTVKDALLNLKEHLKNGPADLSVAKTNHLPSDAAVHWAQQEIEHRAQLDCTIEHAQELLSDGYPSNAPSGAALHLYPELVPHTDNPSPLSTSSNADDCRELNTDEAAISPTANLDPRAKREIGPENGLRRRIPVFGNKPKHRLKTQLLGRFKHQRDMSSPSLDGHQASPNDDRMRELLAHYPEMNLAFMKAAPQNNEIDPARTDRAPDYLRFDSFERVVRSEWNSWVDSGSSKLSRDLSVPLRHAIAEKQLEDFLTQARAFVKGNSCATLYADKTIRREAAPALDACRAKALLWRTLGQEARALQEDLTFDSLLAEPSLWEPAILGLR